VVFLIKDRGSVYSSGKQQCVECLSTIIDAGSTTLINCTKINRPVRLGLRIDKENGSSAVYLCDSKEPKSTRLFTEKISALLNVYVSLRGVFDHRCASHMNQIERRFNSLKHNIINLNAQGIQTGYLFVPQEKFLAATDKSQLIREHIVKDSERAADTFLSIFQKLLLTKHELIVYDLLRQDAVSIDTKKKSHRIHKLIQMALNTYWRDLRDRGIKITHESCDSYVVVEFESFMAALIHVVDNMCKYALSGSEVDICYEIDKAFQQIRVVFSMISYAIAEDEEDRIWEEGYSGRIAQKAQKDGNGLGMFAIRKLVELNGGTVRLFSTGTTVNVENISYKNNNLEITVPLRPKQ